MDIQNIWNHFLLRAKESVSDIAFETWFKETELLELKDDYARILVPDIVHKKHLKENYNEFIEDIFNEITGSNYKIELVTEDEIKSKKTINVDEVGIPSQAVFVSNLDSKYTFENFIVGKANKFARATALAIAEQPGKMYNPLFIWAKSGLGKTHLMHAIGNYITEHSNKKVLYVTSEQFVNDFISLYRKNKTENNVENVDKFKLKYRSIDVLIVDDIQYLEIALTTQQEFFNTFNDLHANNKQIIIASDRSPEDLKKLEERLRTRFTWGITVDIMPPDFELRMAIIDKKIKDKFPDCDFTTEAKEYIASICTSDIRKMEGSINRVAAYASMMGHKTITTDTANEALKDFFGKSVIAKNKIDQVQQLVASHYNITVEDLKSKKRGSNIAVPRQIAMYICRIILEETLPKIGMEFGGKDHTTVMHSVNKIKTEVDKNPALKMEIDKIASKIN